MTHASAEKRIDAYLDNELDTSEGIALIEHAENCPICTERLTVSSKMSDWIKREMPCYRASPELKARLQREIRRRGRTHSPASFDLSIRRTAYIVSAIAFGILAGIFIDSKLIDYNARTGAILEKHIASLKSGHLIDIASSDKHTVKPWFAGKVDFSPFVTDLASLGYPLLGGRSEYFDGHDAAALVYVKGHHYIELYEWPVRGRALESIGVERGYNERFFVYGGMQYCIVSDASKEEMEVFRGKLRDQIDGNSAIVN